MRLRGFCLLAALAFAACGGTTSTAAPTSTSAASASASSPTGERAFAGASAAHFAQLAAVEALPLDPAHLAHHSGGGHDTWGPIAAVPISTSEKAILETQWSVAQQAATHLLTTQQAAAAGYVQASTQLPGIGTHWISWDLIDRPFDSAKPSMLLFDQSPSHPARLAGFSYWVRSATEPIGFAGANDHWHMHHGLCFSNGWLMDEGLADRAACNGTWLNGTDLWMLHAWVVPGAPNRWGDFAPRDAAICPAPDAHVADALRCPYPLPTAAPAAGHDAATDPFFCTLPTA